MPHRYLAFSGLVKLGFERNAEQMESDGGYGILWIYNLGFNIDEPSDRPFRIGLL